MNELPQNELLSAYLDGELTADERARVEELLATDPAARRWVDELQAVRTRLQALPKHTVGEDLGDRVLRAAERRMLGQATAPADAEEPPPSPEMRTWRSVARRILTPRALAWSAAAIVVALVLTFNEVGRQPAPRARLARAPAASTDSSREAPSIHAAPEENKLKMVKSEPAEESAAERLSRPLHRPDANWGMGEGVAMDKDAETLKKDFPGAPTVAKSESATPAPAAMKPAAGALAADQPTAIPAVEGKTAAPEPKSGYFRGKAGAADESGWQREERDRAALLASQTARFSQAQGEVLVVRCQIRPDQTPHQPFQRILASNSIDWEEPLSVPSKAKAEDGRRSLGYEPHERAGEKARPAEPKPASDKKAASGLADQLVEAPPAAKADAAPTAPAGNVEAVLVEATWDQVEATVAELSKRSDVYSSVALESPPGTNVPRALDHYNRRAGQSAGAPELRSAENKLSKAPADAEAAKGANVANAQRRGIARALGPMPPPVMPATAPPAGLPELPPPLSYGGQQEGLEVRQQVVPKAPAPGRASRVGQGSEAGREVQQPQTPAAQPTPGAAGMGGLGIAGPRPAESPAQQSAPSSAALAAEPRTYRVLFLFETAQPPARAAAKVQEAAAPAKP